MTPQNRRAFIKRTAGAAAGLSLLTSACQPDDRAPGAGPSEGAPDAAGDALYRISLAEWSLHRHIPRWNAQPTGERVIDHLDFPRVAQEEFGIDGVEYVNQFFMDKASDTAYLNQMRDRAGDAGVTSLLIMCDGIGNLGAPDLAARTAAVEGHYPWVEAAAHLGCHSIRVNARSEGSYQEQMERAADGLRRLAEFGDQHDINVIVENHGGYSSNGQWLAGVMEMADHERVGTLPDFGNFRISQDEMYDVYQGVEELMPYAKAVSAKSFDFDEAGNHVGFDYERMMKVVLDSGYRGWVGIEYEGDRLGEFEGIRATRDLLVRLRDELAPEYA